MANEMIRQFSKEIQMDDKYTMKCSTLLAIKKTQIKMTLRFFTSLQSEWQLSKMQITNAGENVGEKEPIYIVGGKVN
jgi:hypothetical protein